MEIGIPGRNLNMFSRIIHFCSVLSEHVYLESRGKELVLKAINAARSAYVIFRIDREFFDLLNELEKSLPSFKIPLKSLSAIFRVTDNVDRCLLRFDLAETSLHIENRCQYEVRKTFRVYYTEEECVTVNCSVENLCNRIIGSTSFFRDLVTNFQNTLDEITFSFANNDFIVKTCLDPNRIGDEKLLYTECKVDKAELDFYHVSDLDGHITFSLKELKMFLPLCKDIAQPVTCNFDSPGSPMVFSLNSYGVILCDFLLATSSDPNETSHISSAPPSRMQSQESAGFEYLPPAAINRASQSSVMSMAPPASVESILQHVDNQPLPALEVSETDDPDFIEGTPPDH